MFEVLHYTYVNGLLQASGVAVRGRVAMWDGATGKVKTSDGTAAIGIFAQNVLEVPQNGYRPPHSDDAYLDGRVGIYQDHVVFLTDEFAGAISSYKPGDKIYVTSEGRYTNVQGAPSPTTGDVEIGEVLLVEPSALVIRAKF